PSIDISFGGDYGVYHSVYDDFYWMKHFGDPSFAYHAALARVLGVLALRLDEADILPFDYSAYASEIGRAESDLASRTADEPAQGAILRPLADASAQLMGSAARVSQVLRAVGFESLDPEKQREINHSLVDVEQALLKPGGLSGRPWFKHTVYAPGSYAGYAAEVLPGVAESLDRNDAATLRTEADALLAALRRAAARLDEVAGLAQQAASARAAGR
ncbi:MAG TPA: transferrin receptor-like dimerization domain-containing protein, partial [Verrucomicrobiae bacterium]|nr:transferrin receptor-like dimerization domain-containing protein [Verrucomicrobiae bacterium]